MVGKLNRGGSLGKIQVAPHGREFRDYTAGYQAQAKGLPAASNPWNGQMPQSGNWDQGWADANAGIANPMIAEGYGPPIVADPEGDA